MISIILSFGCLEEFKNTCLINPLRYVCIFISSTFLSDLRWLNVWPIIYLVKFSYKAGKCILLYNPTPMHSNITWLEWLQHAMWSMMLYLHLFCAQRNTHYIPSLKYGVLVNPDVWVAASQRVQNLCQWLWRMFLADLQLKQTMSSTSNCWQFCSPFTF